MLVVAIYQTDMFGSGFSMTATTISTTPNMPSADSLDDDFHEQATTEGSLALQGIRAYCTVQMSSSLTSCHR